MVQLKKREQDKLELNAVRKCSDKCYFFQDGGKGCPYFQKKRVEFGQTCLYDLVHLKGYADAFKDGDLSFIKEDASGLTAMIMLQIRRMLEQVNIEGVTIQEPILDAKGNPVWLPDPEHRPEPGETQRMVPAYRTVDHPLIARCIQMARNIGLNLAEFKLTPKSADEKRAVSGHIIAENPEDIKMVLAERKVIEEKFAVAVTEGNKRTKEDPIYQKLLAEGEIIE